MRSHATAAYFFAPDVASEREEISMTTLLKQAFAQAEKLPDWEQDALAAFILEEIAASYQWNSLEPKVTRSTRLSKQRTAVQHRPQFVP